MDFCEYSKYTGFCPLHKAVAVAMATIFIYLHSFYQLFLQLSFYTNSMPIMTVVWHTATVSIFPKVEVHTVLYMWYICATASPWLTTALLYSQACTYMAIVKYQPISAHTLTVDGYRHMHLYARLYGAFSVSGLFFHQVHSTEDGMQMLCLVSLVKTFLEFFM